MDRGGGRRQPCLAQVDPNNTGARFSAAVVSDISAADVALSMRFRDGASQTEIPAIAEVSDDLTSQSVVERVAPSR